jgi:signal transduction histidine kinase
MTVRSRISGLRADVVLALALVVLWQLEVWVPDAVPWVGATQEHRAALAAAGVAALLPLAWRRVAPLPSCAAVLAGTVLVELVGPSPEGLSELAGVVIASYSVAAYAPSREALTGLGLMVLSQVISQHAKPDDVAFGTLLFGGAWVAGRLVAGARERARELETLTQELALEREESARLAVALERTRIARELHDVVAHAVSVMVVQAGGVRGLLEPRQQDEREALEVIEAAGREAMGELRRMVGVLRAPVDDEGLSPPPSLSHVDALCRHVRDAGLPVELKIDGTPRPLAPGLELSAYRIVQEALTNTLKHAGPAHAEVSVRYGERALELHVCDDGVGARNGTRGDVLDPSMGGHGLVGMRERVRVFGGEFEAGPRPSGGFRVFACLPLESAS